jgi:hypothetical protein
MNRKFLWRDRHDADEQESWSEAIVTFCLVFVLAVLFIKFMSPN